MCNSFVVVVVVNVVIIVVLSPSQVISATQARLAYLTQLGELISYGGRSYTATMMVSVFETIYKGSSQLSIIL